QRSPVTSPLLSRCLQSSPKSGGRLDVCQGSRGGLSSAPSPPHGRSASSPPPPALPPPRGARRRRRSTLTGSTATLPSLSDEVERPSTSSAPLASSPPTASSSCTPSRPSPPAPSSSAPPPYRRLRLTPSKSPRSRPRPSPGCHDARIQGDAGSRSLPRCCRSESKCCPRAGKEARTIGTISNVSHSSRLSTKQIALHSRLHILNRWVACFF
ncbi:unnamed protein product, partial [Urochloa humidicola]